MSTLREIVAEGAVVLRGFAGPVATQLLGAVSEVCAEAPLRHMMTQRGHLMSAAMTNCGAAGWVSDRAGYRYVAADPLSGKPWPAMPQTVRVLATRAAHDAGFAGFASDVCLVNAYEPGARMALHQDRDERDFDAPIVSVSLGLPVTFLFGGRERSDRAQRIALAHGDVVVWGAAARLAFHGVLPLADGTHPATGRRRINLTCRRAL